MCKFFICLLLSAVMVFILPGCSVVQSLGDSRISPFVMTERENLIIAAASDVTMAFDYQVDAKYKYVSLALVEYRFGQKVDNTLANLTCGTEKTGAFVLSFSKPDADKPDVPQKCTLLVSTGGGRMSQLCTLDDIAGKGLSSRAMDWTQAASLPETGRMALACISYTKNGFYSSFSKDFYLDPESHLDGIINDDVTYVLTCEFTEEAPK